MNKTARILFICFLALLAVKSNAQEPFTTYDNTFCGEKFIIFVSSKGNAVFTLWINAMPVDDTSKACGIIVKEDDYNKFINTLKAAKSIYEDNVKAAKEKNVKNLNKTMRLLHSSDVYFKQDKMYMQKEAPLTFDFNVNETNGKTAYLLFINTGRLTALNNTSAHSNGGSLVFSSADEIDQFIDKISTDKIDSFIVKNDSTGYLKRLRKLDGSWHSKAQSGIFSKLFLGIKVEYNTLLATNNITTNNTHEYAIDYAKMNLKNGYNIGAFGRVDFNKFYLQPELLYTSGQNTYILSFLDNHQQVVKFNKTVNINTLDLPLFLGYKIWNSKNTNIRIFAGPRLKFNAGSKVKYTYFHTYSTTKVTDIKTDITPTQWGLETGLGFDFSGFTLDVRYNLTEDMYHSQLNSHTIDNLSANSLVFSVGWKVFRPKR